MASIMFAMFMIIILSLVAIGIASVSRNDQVQTLDKSLSNQAQYAAETAINRTARYLVENPNTAPINTCDDLSVPSELRQPLVDAAIDPTISAEITCLLYTTTPTVIVDDNVGNTPAVYSLRTSNGTPISKIKISWIPGNTVQNTVYPANTTSQLTINGSGDYVPILRAALNNGNAAISGTKVVYMSPIGGGSGTYNIVANESGGIGAGRCINGGSANVNCEITIDIADTTYENVSITSLAGDSGINIQALDSSDNPVQISGAQMQIDATAKSRDVIKRIVASVPLNETNWRPGFAANASKQLCKNYFLDGDTNSKAVIGNLCGVALATNGGTNLNVGPIPSNGGGGNGNFAGWSATNPRWKYGAQIIAVSFAPLYCQYELMFGGETIATYRENSPGNCYAGNTHQFRFEPIGPPGARCDPEVRNGNPGVTACGRPGYYNIRVSVFGQSGEQEVRYRGSTFLPYKPYP